MASTKNGCNGCGSKGSNGNNGVEILSEILTEYELSKLITFAKALSEQHHTQEETDLLFTSMHSFLSFMQAVKGQAKRETQAIILK